MTRQAIATLREAVAAGKTDAEIGAALNLAPRTILNRRRKHGIRQPNLGQQPKFTDAQLTADLAAGESDREIAARYNAAPDTVADRRRAMGIYREPR